MVPPMVDLGELGPVLVTGSGGFIGSHLVPELTALGANVHEVVNSEQCDLRDQEAVRACIDEVQPWAVIHLAATPDGCRALGDGADPHDNTVRSAGNLVAALRGTPSLIIHAGSYKQYETLKSPFSESMRARPVSQYGISKEAAESLVLSHGRFGDGRAVALRIGPVFGPGQDSRRLMPQMLRSLMCADEPPVRVKSCLWDPTYVSDVVEALILALVSPRVHGRVVNISGGLPISVVETGQIAGRVLELSPAYVASRVVITGSEGWHCFGDVTLARSLLGWTAAVGIEDGIRQMLCSRMEAGFDSQHFVRSVTRS